MTATEILRRMLDERGVEWDEYGDGYTLLRYGGREYTVQPNVCNRLIVTNLTPEQAIAATLGSCNCSFNCTNSERTNETCHAEETERFECLDSRYKSFDYNPYITVHVMECSECGGTYEHVNGGYEFCPRCGRKVVDE